MSIKEQKYNDILNIPKTRCIRECEHRFRVYTALSKNINFRALSGTASDSKIKPYVFKVGTTVHNCAQRRKSLVEDRKPTETSEGIVFCEPRYAGVDDWKILKCWEVPQNRYDDTKFKPWLKLSSIRDHVYNLNRYKTAESDGVSATRGFVDLYVMSETFARSMCPTLVNDPLNAELLASVSRAIVFLVSEYAAFLNGFSGSTAAVNEL